MPLPEIVNGLISSGIIYSIILIGLAFSGFIISHMFSLGQHAGIPNPYKSDLEVFFHHVSVGLLGIAILILILAFPLIKFVQASGETFLELGILDQDSATSFIKIFAVLVYFSMGYLILFGVIFYCGVFARFGNAIWIEVEFTDNTKKKFNRYICESDDYYYFEDKDQFRLWEGIKKSDVIRISGLQGESRITLWMRDAVTAISSVFSSLKDLWNRRSQKKSDENQK
jgi:hypothetical protein